MNTKREKEMRDISISWWTKITISTLLLGLHLAALGQKPMALTIYNKGTIPHYWLPAIDNDSLEQSYIQMYGKHNPVFAKNFDVNLATSSSGQWVEDSSGYIHWLHAVTSPTALSIALRLEHCAPPSQSHVYISNPVTRVVSGPFSFKYMDEDSTLLVEPVEGNTVVIEFIVPAATIKTRDYFTITKIGHDFKGYYNESSGKRGVSSEACEIDVTCDDGKGWQKERRSVVRITFEDGTVWRNCTGTFINNTEYDAKPYVLTANHCINSKKRASTAIFRFNYERDSCGATSPSKDRYKSIGASLIATTLQNDIGLLDFSLLRLKSIPAGVKPYYAGWNASDIPPDSVVCIHHPDGDVKKISFSNRPVIRDNFQGVGYVPYTHWHVATWDKGVTEGGSSGSALFNPRHQIVGILSGGESSCKDPHNDYFQSFDKSWDYFPDSTNQLKYWLAPDGNNQTSIEGYDPENSKGSSISNIMNTDSLYVLRFGKKARGAVSGYNELGINAIAEKLAGIQKPYVYGIRFPVVVGRDAPNIQKITLKIWADSAGSSRIMFEHKLRKDSITQGGIYQIRLATHVEIEKTCFVGFEYPSLIESDSVFLYTSSQRQEKGNLMWVKLRNEWMNAENLGICSSLGIELFLTNHKDSIVPMSKLRNVWGSAISNNSNNSNITLFTNELFGKDSVSNIDEHGELQVFEMDNSKGYFAGTNRYDFMRFSEKISKGNQQYIRGLKLIPYLNQFTDTAVKVKLCVWRGLARPDSLVYSELVSLANLTANYCNVIMFKRKVKTDSVCFIGYEILDPYSTDTLALFMGTPKPKTDPEHSFFSAEGSWVNFNLCEIRSSLAVSAHTCYTKYFFEKDSLSYRYKTTGRVTKKKVTSKRISLFPNPTGGAYMYISMGTHFTRDIHVEICDFAGRVISKQTPELIAANVARISVSEIPRGIYLVKTMIQDQYFQPLKIIKK